MSTTLAIIGYRYIHKFSHIVAALSASVFGIRLVPIITSNIGAVVKRTSSTVPHSSSGFPIGRVPRRV
ncbi:hypothetical protein [Paenarthrobacter nitroguajacolicus]|uniref:hypothetical protein n=1 Tax=Paenarthrobacter nitroguajacolicus TaxID=211146 RepID=UPI002855BE65|nr:hypothetical protein [Paenarthrobacter nitroguajacolicus]MDR6639539.1 purine-cytosine permease-like protein [Paenarthrobacter nitroguajacolicus]